jgi:hypothetical protein
MYSANEEDIALAPLHPFYRIYFQDGRWFDYWGTPAEDEVGIARFVPRDVAGYRAFLAETQRLYQGAFVELADQPFLTPGVLLRVVPDLARFGAQRSVYSLNTGCQMIWRCICTCRSGPIRRWPLRAARASLSSHLCPTWRVASTGHARRRSFGIRSSIFLNGSLG